MWELSSEWIGGSGRIFRTRSPVSSPKSEECIRLLNIIGVSSPVPLHSFNSSALLYTFLFHIVWLLAASYPSLFILIRTLLLPGTGNKICLCCLISGKFGPISSTAAALLVDHISRIIRWQSCRWLLINRIQGIGSPCVQGFQLNWDSLKVSRPVYLNYCVRDHETKTK